MTSTAVTPAARSTPRILGPQVCPQRRVERGEGLVEEHHLGVAGQGPGDGDPLLLAARQLVGVALAQVVHADEREQLGDPRRPVGPCRGAAAWQREADVVGHREVREHRALLRHVADPAPLGREALAAVVDHAVTDAHGAGLGRFEAGDDAQQGGLAAARRPEHAGQRAFVDVQRGVDQHRLAAVVGDEVLDVDGAHRRGRPAWVGLMRLAGASGTPTTTGRDGRAAGRGARTRRS